jgi:GNAT superfamily N-acetyltransferase
MVNFNDSNDQSVRIVRLSKSNADAIRLLQEYYEAASVVQRDAPGAIQKIMDTPDSGVWLAYKGENAVGCVVLRKLAFIPFAGECKRLYVQPRARGQGIADNLMDTLETLRATRVCNGSIWTATTD